MPHDGPSTSVASRADAATFHPRTPWIPGGGLRRIRVALAVVNAGFRPAITFATAGSPPSAWTAAGDTFPADTVGSRPVYRCCSLRWIGPS